MNTLEETIKTPRIDLENDLADKKFARQYRDERIKASWEIKMVRELGYVPRERVEVKIEEAKKQERERIFNIQLKALQGDYVDALDCQSEYDNNPNWTESQKKEHHDYWRGQSGAIAKIIDAIEALKSPDKGGGK